MHMTNTVNPVAAAAPSGLASVLPTPAATAPGMQAVLSAGGQPLPADTRAFFEPRFGRDLSGVRVRTGAASEEAARSVRAQAFTTGQDIVFGEGRFAPQSQDGRQLIAHELMHVVQQAGGDGARGQFLQLKPDEAASECIEPGLPTGARETVSFDSGVSEIRGDTHWVLRLWDFAQDDATVTIFQVQGINAFFDAANLRASREAAIQGWAVASVVGHASPEGEEDHNEALAFWRAETVAGACGVAKSAATSGEACGAGAPREDYPWFRAVDVTIEFFKQTVPPQVAIPGTDDALKTTPVVTVGPAKALKDVSGAREGIKDAVEHILTPDSSNGPPRIEINFRKVLEGGGEGASEGVAGFAFDTHIEWSFNRQLQELRPLIQSDIERLRPAAEQMFMDDPAKPVYAIVHTLRPKQADTASDGIKGRVPGAVSLAEPVKLGREPVSRTYEKTGRIVGAPVNVVERHVIESIEIAIRPEE